MPSASRPKVVVVGLGPGAPDLITEAARARLNSLGRRFLRTTHHPSAGAAEPAISFDGIYKRAASLEEVYKGIVETLVDEATVDSPVLYAVPGSPLVGERSVELLREDGRVDVEIVPGLSFLDLAWARLGVDPLAAGVKLVDGQRFAVEAAGESGPLLVAQCDSQKVLSEIKLAVDEGPEVTVLQRLGTSTEEVRKIDWADLDREVRADHLTSIWIPSLAAPVAAELSRFAELVRTLRVRCPWDAEQTHASLASHLLEETYELLEAIENVAATPTAEAYDHLEEELGDVLFQVFFHARLAAEAGQFELSDVARGIHNKLVGRHPHLFGGADEPPGDWEAMKRAEKGRASSMDGIPATLPALAYAQKVIGRAGRNAAQPQERHHPFQMAENLSSDEIGSVLLFVVGRAESAGIDAEAALRAAASGYALEVRRLESGSGS